MPKQMTPRNNRNTATKAKKKSDQMDAKLECRCNRCGKLFRTQKGNFPMSQSSLYAGNNYYISWCFKCLNELYQFYHQICGLEDRDAIRRVCSKIDTYWSENIYRRIEISPANTPNRMSDYIAASNKSCGRYAGMTYDDTLAQEALAEIDAEKDSDSIEPESDREPEPQIPNEYIEFWGDDLSLEEYEALQKRYDKWVSTGKYSEDDPAVQTLLKQICITEYDIERGRVEGKQIDKLQSTLNNYLGSLNAKPSQQKQVSSGLESMPFGVGIQKWQMTRPIPQPKDEWKDVDGVVKYITTWFIGHLCHMLKIDNKYNSMYEQEVEKYTVNRPQEEYDEDIEDTFDDLFGGDET